ncbi:DUF4139 domain-containing protein [Sphingomonas sp. SUN039]|uniref:DUF4139 domain-containing protein n=1 Tax=Sphingomonas sp. SUN039 TaxID=2937787 RepID=UPI002164B8BA|nr:DUF4139 domain-containing protein [Sphingomonas sp. SUN039]UVO55576.1 DUF4139 domain-containing protein [Sphingomonas sp. SUN039]
MRRFALLPLLALSAPLAAQSAQGTVAVTIYNNNLALVQDIRATALPQGRTTVEFPDVSAQIRAETVTIGGADFGIVEQNFDYDLLSPSALMQKAVGQVVTIVRINPATGAETREQAKVLAANGGVVLQIGQRIEVLRDDGLPVRVIFDRVPPNLRARPTLSVTLDSTRAGTRPVSLSYLTPGLGWKADYVALFDEGLGKIDVQGWVTLTNNSGTTYTNAETLLVAGQVGDSQPQYGRSYNPQPQRGGMIKPGTETANRAQLGDFYLYPIKERTTIAQAQQKQVSFLDVGGAAAAKGYEYRNGWLGTQTEAQSADTVLRFSTSRDGGLGDALPAGTVRVYMKDAKGQPQFIGENTIGHTPMGSALGLKTGEAFDVKVKPVVEKRERLSDIRWRTSMRYTLTNARNAPVVVDLTQAGLDNYWDDTRILSESQKSERRSSDEAVWKVTVPANGEATVTAVFDTRY